MDCHSRRRSLLWSRLSSWQSTCLSDTGPAMRLPVKRRGEPCCAMRRKISRSSLCRAWPVRTARRRRLFPPGGSSAKSPPMRGRRVRGSQSCWPRSYGQTPHIPYVFVVIIGPLADSWEGISQFSTALISFDAATVHFASAISIILVLYGLYAFVGRGVTAAVCQGIALQVRCHVSPGLPVISHDREKLLGVLLAKTALSQSRLASAILLAVAYTSACNVLMIDMVPFAPPLLP